MSRPSPLSLPLHTLDLGRRSKQVISVEVQLKSGSDGTRIHRIVKDMNDRVVITLHTLLAAYRPIAYE
jgi:hypothetical protein